MEESEHQEPKDMIPERPHVLLLRSYARDKTAVENAMMARDSAIGAAMIAFGALGLVLRERFKPTSFMQFLSRQLEERVGPLKSLEPSQVGVAASEDDWKQHIRTLVNQAQIVLILPGTTPGLAWELAYLRSFFPPTQVLLLNEPYGVDRIPWAAVVRQFSAQGWTLPEQDPGAGTVLCLDSKWCASVFADNCVTPADYAIAVCFAWNELVDEEEEGPPQSNHGEQSTNTEQLKVERWGADAQSALSVSAEKLEVERWVADALNWLHGGFGGALLVLVAGGIAVMTVLETGPHQRGSLGRNGAAGLFFGSLMGVYVVTRFLIFLIAQIKSKRE